MMKGSKGFTLVEVMIALGLLSVLVVGVIGSVQLLGASLTVGNNRVQAGGLAREGMDAVLSIRAEDFESINPGTYYPVRSGLVWSLSAGEEVVGKYTRRVIVDRAYRSLICDDAVCPLVMGGGIADEGSYWVTVQVDWNEGESRQIELKNLITYWR